MKMEEKRRGPETIWEGRKNIIKPIVLENLKENLNEKDNIMAILK